MEARNSRSAVKRIRWNRLGAFFFLLQQMCGSHKIRRREDTFAQWISPRRMLHEIQASADKTGGVRMSSQSSLEATLLRCITFQHCQTSPGTIHDARSPAVTDIHVDFIERVLNRRCLWIPLGVDVNRCYKWERRKFNTNYSAAHFYSWEKGTTWRSDYYVTHQHTHWRIHHEEMKYLCHNERRNCSKFTFPASGNEIRLKLLRKSLPACAGIVMCESIRHTTPSVQPQGSEVIENYHIIITSSPHSREGWARTLRSSKWIFHCPVFCPHPLQSCNLSSMHWRKL